MRSIMQAVRRLQSLAFTDPSLSAVIKPYSQNYPWQWYTRLKGVQITAKLRSEFCPDRLKKDLDEVLLHHAGVEQSGPYHAGGWTSVSLHAVDGNPEQDLDIPGANFAKTPAIKWAPYMEEIMDAIPAKKRRVRLLSLDPGKRIFWHRDPWHSVDSQQVRLHIPILTNDKVDFQLGHERCSWQPGEMWYGDFTFPHRLQNGGDHARVHLVIDVETNDAIRAMLRETLLQQSALRMKARARCDQLMRAWNYCFATEYRITAPKP